MNRAGNQNPKSFDWQAVRDRLAKAEAAVNEALHPSPERVKAILETRARELARVPGTTASRGSVISIVEFAIGGERFGIDARFVLEVVRLGSCTPIPDAPDFVRGLSNLRGVIMPVLNLRRFLNITIEPLNDNLIALVLGKERAEFCLLIDEATGQDEIAVDSIHPFRSGTEIGSPKWIQGVTDEALIVVDGQSLLQDERLNISR